MMAESAAKVELIAQKLGTLAGFCDRGFALAVHIRYTRPTLLYQTYDRAWSETYSLKGYMLADPVVHWGLMNNGWVEWASLVGQDPEGVIADAVAHGLANGWTYSVGPASSRTIAGLPRSGPPFTAAERAEMATLVDVIHAETEGFDSFSAPLQDKLRKLP
jgi:LuxR family transcriptional regulator, quorum-sensing system regulator SdiA